MADDETSPRPAPLPRDGEFTARETLVDGLVVVSVGGSVDMLSAPWLTEAIDSALAKRPAGLIVDLSDVDFLASAGISILVAAHSNTDHSGRFGVVCDGPATYRPLTLMGLDEIIPLYHTLGDAVDELRSC